MFLLSTQNSFYIILSSYIEEHVQKNSSLNFMSSVGFHTSNLDVFLKHLMWDKFWDHF